MCRSPLCLLPCNICSLLLDGWAMRCGRLLVVRRTLAGRRDLREHRDYSKIKCFSCGNMGHTSRLVVQSQIQHFHSDRMAETSSQMFHDSGLTVPHRETRSRPGPHPHHAIHQDLTSSSFSSSVHTSDSFNFHVNHSAVGNSVQFMDQGVAMLTGASIVRSTDSSPIPDQEVVCTTDHAPADLLMHRPDITCVERVDDSVMQISGTGHWFLEGWIGDHSVDFLVDSGSSVTVMSNSLYQTLVRTGAPLVVLEITLRSANGTGIGVSGCSHCVVSFMGLQMEFPILVCGRCHHGH